MSILSFWRKWDLGAPTNRFPLVWEKSSNGKWLKMAFEKTPTYRYLRAEMIVTQYVLSNNSLFPAHQSQTKYFRKTFRQMFLWPHQLQKTNDKKSNLCCMKKRDCSTDANMKTVRNVFLKYFVWDWWAGNKELWSKPSQDHLKVMCFQVRAISSRLWFTYIFAFDSGNFRREPKERERERERERGGRGGEGGGGEMERNFTCVYMWYYCLDDYMEGLFLQ